MKDVRKALELRTRLEDRIHELGGKLPEPWPWDDGELRNHQLIELVEKLEGQHQREGQPPLQQRS